MAPGEWMRPASRPKVDGLICIAPLTAAVERSISCSTPSKTPPLLNAPLERVPLRFKELERPE
jgi:hypothetical protein